MSTDTRELLQEIDKEFDEGAPEAFIGDLVYVSAFAKLGFGITHTFADRYKLLNTTLAKSWDPSQFLLDFCQARHFALPGDGGLRLFALVRSFPVEYTTPEGKGTRLQNIVVGPQRWSFAAFLERAGRPLGCPRLPCTLKFRKYGWSSFLKDAGKALLSPKRTK